MIGRPAIRPVRAPLRPLLVPIVSTLAGSAMILAPMVSSAPQMPPFGLLMLLSWRLLRPEMWPAWIALPLGLYDDMLTGHFLGTSMGLWTIAFLAFDWIDHHVVWRDYWMEWIIAATSIAIIQAATWAFSQTPGANGTLLSAVPETMVAILVFPAMVRLTALLDRWRLAR
jgi:rod shape-determining protein MreD